MSCPHCKDNTATVKFPVKVNRVYPCYESAMIKEELKKYFNFKINVFNHQVITCADCGTRWKFKVEFHDVQPVYNVKNPEWYEVIALKCMQTKHKNSVTMCCIQGHDVMMV